MRLIPKHKALDEIAILIDSSRERRKVEPECIVITPSEEYDLLNDPRFKTYCKTYGTVHRVAGKRFQSIDGGLPITVTPCAMFANVPIVTCPEGYA